ncbi:nucleotidyltransferase [Rhizobium leguminosarum]|uniref:SMODS domain-containing nucleotidyltransferase n=1 Tax=Rhizobium leguminosarum TaxID=384 RepID=UPI001C989C3C|nr:hypothetical protein [Rhizobium leguminosarum]MBY5917739.1 nucleotidyltransferase [Rhizobium leguminosarum]
MWIAVRERFRRFAADLVLTDEQVQDGVTKFTNIGRSLERTCYGGNFGDHPPVFMVGSWGKRTQVRPPRDLDCFFIMPASEKARFDARSGNVQSALLQEVKGSLELTYPSSRMRGDGQVVEVAFNSLTVEVLPVFAIGNGQFWMPDTNGGGAWKIVDPIAQINVVHAADTAMNGNVRLLSKMMKLWAREQNVSIKSFLIELLVAEFLPARGNGGYDFFWYDYYVRDFFIYLLSRVNGYIAIPGTGQYLPLGNDWAYKATRARDVAIEACHWEYHDYDVTAGQEWQKIFGNRIQTHIR